MEPIWEWNTKLIALESDPEVSYQLFVLDEEKRIIVLEDIYESEENRFRVKNIIDLNGQHDLTNDFEFLDFPWKSVVIN